MIRAGLLLLSLAGCSADLDAAEPPAVSAPAPPARVETCQPVREPPMPPKVPRKYGELREYALQLTVALDYANQALADCGRRVRSLSKKAAP